MKSKLYKTHRKASYYRLRRLGYFSMSLMVATIIVVVPLTLAQASTASSNPVSSTTSLQNTKTLEKVFTNELQQRKLMLQNRRNLLWSVLFISTIILSIYVFTPLFQIIQ